MSDLYNPQLDTFLRVADAGSFSKAAEEMYITPTAVIKQINLLEGSLGVMLFIRTHRGLHLTEAGKVFYAGCSVHCRVLPKGGAECPKGCEAG